MYRFVKFVSAVLIASSANAAVPQIVNVDGLFDIADARLRNRVTALSSGATRWPISRDASTSTWNAPTQIEWDSGYFPGLLWQMYRRDHNADYLNWAKRWTHAIVGVGANDPIPASAWTTAMLPPAGHDVGLVFLNSFAEAYESTGDTSYAKVVNHAATQLNNRFNASRGTMRSWDWGTWTYPVIIDGMMSVQALNWSADHGGSATLRTNAATHARNSALRHVRADGSTYHVVDFGKSPPVGSTYQGYDNESTWSRGQAWAIYGFAASNRATNDPLLLDAARHTADYWITHTTDDPVPLWDFELPTGGPATLYRRDSSAAAIAASGLLDLSFQTDRPAEQRRYFQAAEAILNRLASPDYLAASAAGETRLLLHGVGSYKSNSAVDADLIYADYYFLEALDRYEDAGPGPGIVKGDANRDGAVNFVDLVVLAQNYNLTGRDWLTADFNRDGKVDFLDLVPLAQNYSRPAAFTADWALAQSLAVPEPATLAAIAVTPPLVARRKRGRASQP